MSVLQQFYDIVNGNNLPGYALVINGIIAIIIGGIAIWLGRSIKLDSPELRITAVLVAGVFVLILTLAFLSISFATLRVGDRTQALGLPPGSMGAVIALSLVVLFAIVSVFLFHGLSNIGNVQKITNISPQQRDEFQQRLTGFVSSRQENQEVGDAARFTIYFQNNNTSGSEFAKQLLVMLGTLMTAAASFYFGSNSSRPAPEPIPVASPSPSPSPSGSPTPSPSASTVPSPTASPTPSPSPSASP